MSRKNNGPQKKYPHEALTNALRELNIGCHTFAHLCGITPLEMKQVMFCEIVPGRRNLKKDAEVRSRFQELTGILWEDLFPDKFVATRNILAEASTELGHVATVASSMLCEYGFVPNGGPATPFEEVVRKELPTLDEVIEESLESLEPRQAEVLRLRFLEGWTRKKCGAKYNVTKERIRQIEVRALWCMRHPKREKRIREVFPLR